MPNLSADTSGSDFVRQQGEVWNKTLMDITNAYSSMYDRRAKLEENAAIRAQNRIEDQEDAEAKRLREKEESKPFKSLILEQIENIEKKKAKLKTGINIEDKSSEPISRGAASTLETKTPMEEPVSRTPTLPETTPVDPNFAPDATANEPLSQFDEFDPPVTRSESIPTEPLSPFDDPDVVGKPVAQVDEKGQPIDSIMQEKTVIPPEALRPKEDVLKEVGLSEERKKKLMDELDSLPQKDLPQYLEGLKAYEALLDENQTKWGTAGYPLIPIGDLSIAQLHINNVTAMEKRFNEWEVNEGENYVVSLLQEYKKDPSIKNKTQEGFKSWALENYGVYKEDPTGEKSIKKQKVMTMFDPKAERIQEMIKSEFYNRNEADALESKKAKEKAEIAKAEQEKLDNLSDKQQDDYHKIAAASLAADKFVQDTNTAIAAQETILKGATREAAGDDAVADLIKRKVEAVNRSESLQLAQKLAANGISSAAKLADKYKNKLPLSSIEQQAIIDVLGNEAKFENKSGETTVTTTEDPVPKEVFPGANSPAPSGSTKTVTKKIPTTDDARKYLKMANDDEAKAAELMERDGFSNEF